MSDAFFDITPLDQDKSLTPSWSWSTGWRVSSPKGSANEALVMEDTGAGYSMLVWLRPVRSFRSGVED